MRSKILIRLAIAALCACLTLAGCAGGGARDESKTLGEASSESSVSDVSAESSAAEVSDENSTSEASAESGGSEVSDESSTADESYENSTSEASGESSVSDVSAESGAAEVSDESSTADESYENSISEASGESSTPDESDVVVSLPQQQPADEPKQEQPSVADPEEPADESESGSFTPTATTHTHSFGEWSKATATGSYYSYVDIDNNDAPLTNDEVKKAMSDGWHLFRTCKECGRGEMTHIGNIIDYVKPEDAEWICNRIIELLNEERAALGAPALSTAPIAHEMAMVRAEELTRYFSHTRPDGSDAQKAVYQEYEYGIPTKYGLPEDEWHLLNEEKIATAPIVYSCPGSEDIMAIGGDDFVASTAEDIARDCVETFKLGQNTSGHWKDLTNPEYTGVGIGVVFGTDAGVVATNNKGAGLKYFYIAILTMDKTYG